MEGFWDDRLYVVSVVFRAAREAYGNRSAVKEIEGFVKSDERSSVEHHEFLAVTSQNDLPPPPSGSPLSTGRETILLPVLRAPPARAPL